MIIRENFVFSAQKTVATPDLNRLDETVQMRGHNIVSLRNKNSPSIIIKYSSNLEL